MAGEGLVSVWALAVSFGEFLVSFCVRNFARQKWDDSGCAAKLAAAAVWCVQPNWEGARAEMASVFWTFVHVQIPGRMARKFSGEGSWTEQQPTTRRPSPMSLRRSCWLLASGLRRKSATRKSGY